jgi:hypothetical protein
VGESARAAGAARSAELPADFVVQDFDVAPDGSEVMLAKVQGNSDLALIERAP